jgi:hypothetical protein
MNTQPSPEPVSENHKKVVEELYGRFLCDEVYANDPDEEGVGISRAQIERILANNFPESHARKDALLSLRSKIVVSGVKWIRVEAIESAITSELAKGTV